MTEVRADIVADSSTVAPAAEAAGSAIKSLGAVVQGLVDVFLELGGAATGSFREIRTGAVEAGEAVKGAAEGVVELRETIAGFGEALIAAFAVEQITEWVGKTGEAAEHTSQLADKLGMSTAQMQGWNAVATLTGRSTNQFATAFTRLTDNLIKGAGGAKQQATAMRDMGLSASDALNPSEAIIKASERFAQMKAAGETGRAIADSMALMGRSGADMLSIFERGPAAIQAMMDKGNEFGTVLTDGVNARVLATNDKLNELKLHLEGLTTQTFVALAPQIEQTATAFGNFAQGVVKAIQPGSDFRNMVDGVTKVVLALAASLTIYLIPALVGMAAKALIGSEALAALGTILGMTTSVADLGAAFGLLTGAIAGTTEGLIGLTAAMIANPVTLLAIGIAALVGGYELWTAKTEEQAQAERDLKSAQDDELALQGEIASMDRDATEASMGLARAKLTEATAHLAAAQATLAEKKAKLETDTSQQAISTSADLGMGFSNTGVAALFDQHQADQAAGALETQSKAVQQLSDNLQQLSTHLENLPPPPKLGALAVPKPPKAGTGGESDMTALQDQFELQENKRNDTLRDAHADELAYWTTVAASMKNVQGEALQQGDIDRVNAKVASLTHQEAMGAIQDEIAKRKSAAVSTISDVATQQSAYRASIQEQIRAEEDKAKRGEVSRATATAKIKDLINDEAGAAIAAAFKEMQARQEVDQWIMSHAEEGTTAYKDALKDQIAAVDQFEKSRVAADNDANKQIQSSTEQAAQQFKSAWDKVINPLVSSFTSGMLAMAEGTKSLVQVMRGLGQQILNDMLRVVDWIVENWLLGEYQKLAATKVATAATVATQRTGAAQGMAISGVTALKTVTNEAVQAAAAAYHAMAGIPIIGPALGAAAAATTFAAVEAFGGLVASAAGGYDVPSGLNPLTQLHAQEMVLPAPLANSVREMAAGGDGGGGLGGAGGGNHVHNWNITTLDGAGFLGYLRDNKQHLQTAFGEIVRGGGASSMGLQTI